jgi:Peptidase A4 family
MVRHIGWLCGFVMVLLMSWVSRASTPTPGAVPSAWHLLTGAPWSTLWTPPLALVDPRVVHPPRIRVGPATATNWSGYAVTGPAGSVSDVTGSWVVPSVTWAAGETSYASFWIGIDGDSLSSPTLEQIGTISSCRNGIPTYYAWFEFFPRLSRIIRRVPVVPGDAIAAEVKYDASDEWIAEAPAAIGGGPPARQLRRHRLWRGLHRRQLDL